jgi:hypothetical protein
LFDSISFGWVEVEPIDVGSNEEFVGICENVGETEILFGVNERGNVDEGCIKEGRGSGGGGRGISKISTILEYKLPLYPPAKNILFVDDVDASQERG